ncbi:hypothetical protein MHO82_23320 [Vibrio sp. Of7-15]|uniref:hypothetical protein n=1 Tax=Vibrio sp. Of7-15 TaxID=2724879 RepID=UPI001EF1CB26|nr:hypothetical protein [Vibrio sp. Of7-15]MCG7499802.1 hypothetical protein [Vibrio sp. Of7-15]
MAFFIKDTKLKVAEREIFHNEEGYIGFPSKDLVVFDNDTLLPIGLLSYNLFDSDSDEKILIAVPNLQGIPEGDYGAITYSFINKEEGWRLDDEFLHDSALDEEEDYISNYHQAHEFFIKHKHVTAFGRKAPLFEIGGQPPLGQNWDSILYNERGDNPELDRYHEVTSNISDPDFEYMSTRDITYFNEREEQEFIFLGCFSDTPYLDLAGKFMVFYQPDLKKVMLVIEYD